MLLIKTMISFIFLLLISGIKLPKAERIKSSLFESNEEENKKRMKDARKFCINEIGGVLNNQIQIKLPVDPHPLMKTFKSDRRTRRLPNSNSSVYLQIIDNPRAETSMVLVEQAYRVIRDEFCLNFRNYFRHNINNNNDTESRIDNGDNAIPVWLFVIDSAQKYSEFHLQWHHFSNWKGVTRVVIIFIHPNEKLLLLYLQQFVSHPNTRVHIIITNPITKVLIPEYFMSHKMFEKFDISVFDIPTLSYYKYRDFKELETKIRMNKLFMKQGYFHGYHYEEIPKNNQRKDRLKQMRLFEFDKETHGRKLDMKLVGIFQQTNISLETNIRLTVGTPYTKKHFSNIDLSTSSRTCLRFREPQYSQVYQSFVFEAYRHSLQVNCVFRVLPQPKFKNSVTQMFHGFLQLRPLQLSKGKLTLRLYAMKRHKNATKKHFVIFIDGTRTNRIWIDATHLFQEVTILSETPLRYVYNQSKLINFVDISFRAMSFTKREKLLVWYLERSVNAPYQFFKQHFKSIYGVNEFEMEVMLDDRRRFSYSDKFDQSKFECFTLPSPQLYFDVDMREWNHSNSHLNTTLYLWKRDECEFKPGFRTDPNIYTAICKPWMDITPQVFGRVENKWIQFYNSLRSKTKCAPVTDPYYKGPQMISNSSTLQLTNLSFNRTLKTLEFELLPPSNKELYRIDQCFLSKHQLNPSHFDFMNSDWENKTSGYNCVKLRRCSYNYKDATIPQFLSQSPVIQMNTRRFKDLKSGVYIDKANLQLTTAAINHLDFKNQSKIFIYCSVSKCHKDYKSPIEDSCVNKFLRSKRCGGNTVFARSLIVSNSISYISNTKPLFSRLVTLIIVLTSIFILFIIVSVMLLYLCLLKFYPHCCLPQSLCNNNRSSLKPRIKKWDQITSCCCGWPRISQLNLENDVSNAAMTKNCNSTILGASYVCVVNEKVPMTSNKQTPLAVDTQPLLNQNNHANNVITTTNSINLDNNPNTIAMCNFTMEPILPTNSQGQQNSSLTTTNSSGIEFYNSQLYRNKDEINNMNNSNNSTKTNTNNNNNNNNLSTSSSNFSSSRQTLKQQNNLLTSNIKNLTNVDNIDNTNNNDNNISNVNVKNRIKNNSDSNSSNSTYTNSSNYTKWRRLKLIPPFFNSLFSNNNNNYNNSNSNNSSNSNLKANQKLFNQNNDKKTITISSNHRINCQKY